ncbi:MAG: hypothetical protein KatS3mg124_2472 [Porticoccaceae bacterium]|nr:MAG: hypothetical protein KatS3mg124_2472 [Porticoccaceae bacterium]
MRSFLLGNARYWLEEFHADGLRVDAVSSMLYLDYGRGPGEWLPNPFGGRENLDAVDFLRALNERLAARFPGALIAAEESTAWPGVTRPVAEGGLGFRFKWNLGWMNDTLRYMARDPIHRRFHHEEITFGILYAASEAFILPLSHDEVVHGKGSLLSKMPGDRWRRFANLRAYYGMMWAWPGKKLLFMGGEFAQEGEWRHEHALDWHLLADSRHAGVQRLVRDLNQLYRSEPALHELDCDPAGFEWVQVDRRELSVFAWLRRGAGGRTALAVSNLTPVPRFDYRVGVPAGGYWRERINTDAREYGGSGLGNLGGMVAEAAPWDGRPFSLSLVLPPLATLIFTGPE